MFAWFSQTMGPFFEICSSFPTVIFSFLLLISLFYGFLMLLGAVDIDAIDIDTPDIDADLDAEGLENLGVVSGLLFRLGLNGVPLMVVFMLIALLGWMISFSATYFLAPILHGLVIEIAISLVILLSSLWLAALLTAKILKPIRPIFKSLDQETQKTIVGQVAVVRTGRVNNTFGEATFNDGGAGLIVKVRTYSNDTEFKRGDEIVLVEYVEAEGIYRVISKEDFEA